MSKPIVTSLLNGPGRYDDICSQARTAAKAAGVVLLVIDGEHGPGFSVQASLEVLLKLPEILRVCADSIEQTKYTLNVNDLRKL